MNESTPRLLMRTDYFRRPFAPLHRTDARKEWQHFVVHAPDLDLIVNYSINDRVGPDGRRWVDPRTIAIATTPDGTYTSLQHRDPADTIVGLSTDGARLGSDRMVTNPEGYVVSFGNEHDEVAGIIRLEPRATPFVINNRRLSARARLSWLFVPRLVAGGHVRVGDRRMAFDDAPAYHDHNWGHFDWGDDFGWEWGCFLPADASLRWSAIYMRMTDRQALSSRGQALYVWDGADAAAMWRDRQVDVVWNGRFTEPPDVVVPPMARVLRPARRSDLPRRLDVSTTTSGGTIEAARLRFEPSRLAQVVVPDEVRGHGTVVLNESHGAAELDLVDGAGLVETVRLKGTYEYVRG